MRIGDAARAIAETAHEVTGADFGVQAWQELFQGCFECGVVIDCTQGGDEDFLPGIKGPRGGGAAGAREDDGDGAALLGLPPDQAAGFELVEHAGTGGLAEPDPLAEFGAPEAGKFGEDNEGGGPAEADTGRPGGGCGHPVGQVQHGCAEQVRQA